MMYSNLSKIKTKFRTEGQITGNWGKKKVKAGSSLSQIGMSSKDVIKVTKPSDYIQRMIQAFHSTDDPKLKEFCYYELHRLHAI